MINVNRIVEQVRIRLSDWQPALPPLAIQGHVPKSAGKSIRRWIEQTIPSWAVHSRKERLNGPPADKFFVYLGHQRPDLLFQSGLFRSSDVDAAFSFIFVRNPYARIVSLYNHKRRFGYDQPFSKFVVDCRASWFSHRDTESIGLRTMSRPMSDWINQRYWPGWKKIFRVEEFSEAASIVQSQLELPPISRKIDESPDSYRRKIIRESDGLIIAEMYAEDFEKFQYSFAIPEILAEDC